MAVSFLPIILMFLSASGGMNELLDLTDPQSYLQKQGVEYRLEALLEVLAEPATQEADQRKAQEVKKLLAMRALGSLGDQAALPALEKAAALEAHFFNEYASEAIAAIKGEPFAAPSVSAEEMKEDLALLPEGVGLVIQARLDAPSKIDLKKVVGEVLKSIPDGPDPAEVLAQINAEIGKIAGKIGNVRLDGVTMGISEDVGDSAGFVVMIGRGKYDPRSLEGLLSEQKRSDRHEIGGTMFLGIDGGNLAIAPVSSERLVIVAGPGWDEFPLEEVAARLKARPVEPVFSAELRKVIGRADTSGSLWGAGLIPPGMKEAPPFAPFDEMVLSTREIESEGQTLLKLEALGSDVAAVAAKVTEMKQMVEQGIAEMEGRPQAGMGPILKIMKGLRFYSMGLNATISAKLDGNPANIFSMLMPLLSVRSEVQPGPPVQQLEPAERAP